MYIFFLLGKMRKWNDSSIVNSKGREFQLFGREKSWQVHVVEEHGFEFWDQGSDSRTYTCTDYGSKGKVTPLSGLHFLTVKGKGNVTTVQSSACHSATVTKCELQLYLLPSSPLIQTPR